MGPAIFLWIFFRRKQRQMPRIWNWKLADCRRIWNKKTSSFRLQLPLLRRFTLSLEFTFHYYYYYHYLVAHLLILFSGLIRIFIFCFTLFKFLHHSLIVSFACFFGWIGVDFARCSIFLIKQYTHRCPSIRIFFY